MQVSVYLSEELVRRVDRLARKEKRSRSRVIEALLASSLKRHEGSSRIAALAGAWKDTRSAEEIIAEIYGSRRSRRPDRVAF